MSGQTPTWFSVVVFLVALASLGFSIYNILRDRGRVRATSTFEGPSEYGKGQIVITIVNAGRRAAILRYPVYEGADGDWIGGSFTDNKSELRLGENERHDMIVEADDLVQEGPDQTVRVKSIWFEDTLGRRYRIKNIEKNIDKLDEANYSRSDR